MARLPLNTLSAFRAVAEVQNLRAAADTLHLTHSAVSQQIRGLEEHLGFALFDRRGRRVVLNAAGEALLRSVQGALALLDDGVQAAAAAASGSAQRLRVTVLPSFAQRWLLPRIVRWRERYPELALEIDASITRRRHPARGLSRRDSPGHRSVAGPCVRATVRPAADHRGRLARPPRAGCWARSPRRWRASRCWATPTCGSRGSPRRCEPSRASQRSAQREQGRRHDGRGVQRRGAHAAGGRAEPGARALPAKSWPRTRWATAASCGFRRYRSCTRTPSRITSSIRRACGRGRRSIRCGSGCATSSDRSDRGAAHPPRSRPTSGHLTA